LFGLGVASGANIFVERIFDGNGRQVTPFPSDETMTHDAVRNGAVIGANSWGNDVAGEYDTDAAQFDELVRDADSGTVGDQPFVLEFSVGNSGPGPQTISSPATAKNVIAVGASENITNWLAVTRNYCADGPDAIAPFSSRGPCADGRLKPDLVAPGSWIASAASSLAPNGATGAWAGIDHYYVYLGGTSMAGPMVAGAAAVFVQYYEATQVNSVPSPALVKAALINSADALTTTNGGPGAIPNNAEGWGRVDLVNIVTTNATAPRYYRFLDQTVLLTNGAVYAEHFFVSGSDQPLKMTLAYTDVPGFPGANPALVNDLDLEVVAPDGTLYRGNQFNGGESIPNAASPDSLNNVEGVFLSHPQPGDYTVRVRASRVVQDARLDTAEADQDFALVSSGNLERPGTGFVLLDRAVYTAPDTMKVSVFDAAKAGMASVTALVTNFTAQTFTAATLTAAGNYGVFTGEVDTVKGVAGAGELQLVDGDLLAAEYLDDSSVIRKALATADLAGPTYSNLNVTNDVGLLTLTWKTSEPATSIIHYGTNSAALNLVVTNLMLVTNHVVKLSGLTPGVTYYFSIGGSDSIGNSTTDDNAGSFYTFNGIATPTVLLVDAYDTAVETTNGAIVIPDSAYTNVLSAAGITYGFWKVNARGYPQLGDLQPYPMVIWRVTDDLVNYRGEGTNNTLNAPQQTMIQSYLNGGGSLFIASMGMLSKIGNVPFRQQVLQIGSFKTNFYSPVPCLECDEDYGVSSFYAAAAFMGESTNVTLNYSSYPVFNSASGAVFGPDFSDTFAVASNATAVVFESRSGKPCGVAYPSVGVNSPGRVVFLSFPLDAVPTDVAVTLLQNATAFLVPSVDGQGSLWLDHAVYRTNGIVTVELGDAGLAGTGQATVTFTASSSTNQVAVTLNETARHGLFRGTLALANIASGTNQLAVQDGDTLTVTHVNSSSGSNVLAVATIDATPPVLAQVAASAHYFDATVTWQTSEPSDASVQYGLSPTLDHSSTLSTMGTNHSITIYGLIANQTYYFQIISHDLAGNAATANNNGSLYIFQTHAPLPLPWGDDLELGATNWNVVADPVMGSDLNWTLGTPNNLLVSAASSGTNAWSSDLTNSQSFISANSYLYSPALDLTGLKSASLTFSNVFAFNQIDPVYSNYVESGAVYVATNGGGSPASLVLLGSFNGRNANAWEQERLDLTQFTNQVIQIVFGYKAIPGYALNGWTLDDIGVHGVIAGGDIGITKNLGQGSWTLFAVTTNGLVPVQSSVVPAAMISNAPPGQYVVQYSDVPYYLTPAPQTNNVVIGGLINFTGNYTFADLNSNGISDAWEEAFFGSVTTNRTASTDTDGDGMTDYAEFIAGTNPTNAASRFYFTNVAAVNGLVQMQWPAVSNRLYQVSVSADLAAWNAASDWMQATNTATMSYTATNSGDGPQFFRLQVKP